MKSVVIVCIVFKVHVNTPMNQQDEKSDKENVRSRICSKFVRRQVSYLEFDAACNILSQSPHTTMSFLPNHHIDEENALNGFVFQAHKDDYAAVLPISSNTFEMTCLYELTQAQETSSFDPQILHILNNVNEYTQIIKKVIDEIDQQRMTQFNFNCLPDVNDSADYMTFNDVDSQSWSESVPSRVGLYHTFGRSKTGPGRKHRMFIIIRGHLRVASEALHYLWQDARNEITCKQFAETEEVNALRQATIRNHNRIAYKIGNAMNLKPRCIVDEQDPLRQRMMIPSCVTYHNDIRFDIQTDVIRMVRGGCFTAFSPNGIVFDMCGVDGFWIFVGPDDTTTCNEFGNIFSSRGWDVFPTETFALQKEDALNLTNCVRTEDKCIFCPNEKFFNVAAEMGHDRNDGIMHLMPLCCV